MRKLCLILGLAALMISPAAAADLGKSQPGSTLDLPVIPAPAKRNWSGPYIGAGFGYTAHSIDIPNEPSDFSADNAIVTGRIGFDRQLGSVVVGVFGDIDWTNVKATIHGDKVKGDFTYALGARGGMLFGDVLGYVNGGWQWTSFDIQANQNYDPSGLFLGAGLEAPLGNSWSIGVEGRHAWARDNDTDDSNYSGRILLIKKF